MNQRTTGADTLGTQYERTDAPAAIAAVKRISWGAVFAGVAVVLALQLLLGTLGLGIGASTFNPTTEQNPAGGLGIGAAIWFTISTIIALYAGSVVAGRLAGMPLKTDGTLHGLVVWSLSTLVTFYLLTTAIGGIIGGTASILGKGLSVAGQTAAVAANSAGNAASGSTVNQNTVDQAQAKVDQLKNQAENKIGQLKQQAQQNAPQIDAQARQTGEAAASNLSKAALATFAVLLLGAIAAALGGGSGAPRDMRARPTAAV